MTQGEVLTSEHVRSIRPGYGLSPKYLEQVLGQKVQMNVRRGEPLSEKHLQKSLL